MSTFFRKPGFKIAGTILCILSLTAGLVCGILVWLLLASGCYEGSGHLYQGCLDRILYQDAASIMYDYFDPDDPTHPWASYYSGGIYTGEGSNLVYTIAQDGSETPVLATYDRKEDTFYSDFFYYTFETADTAVQEAPDTLSSSVFFCDGTYYGFNGDYFAALDEFTAQYISDIAVLPGDVYTDGFTYGAVYYAFDGDDFVPTEQATEFSYVATTYVITCYLRSGLPYSDTYRMIFNLTNAVEFYRYELIWGNAIGLVLGLLLLVLLGCSFGRVNGQEEPVLNPLFRVPPDVGLLAGMLLTALAYALAESPLQSGSFASILALDVGLLLVLVCLGVYYLMLLCVRGKTHTLISGTFLCWCVHNLRHFVRWLGRSVRKAANFLPLLWKVGICYGLLCILELFGLLLFYWGSSVILVLWFLEKLVLGALVAYVTLAFHRLKCGAEAIAAGDYNTQVDERHLVLDFKDTAETLNHIQDGMSAAVDSRMKSERLKTELITNVSHDLKTPLTSIVSYVDLLKQEPVGSPAAGEYLEVLDRQSARLKNLVEDLVEVSKASTGNITVHAEALDLSLLLGQALGEYNERLLAAQLSPVIKAPETPVTVFADGRLLWRIFDNLLGNAVKYALPGTRLYVTVTADTQATVTFRNISREPLDVSADELMERFVRGDASRHTEGSGLGLSIARSLAESMGGTFQLSLDGDLFKATVSFPLAPENSSLETQA